MPTPEDIGQLRSDVTFLRGQFVALEERVSAMEKKMSETHEPPEPAPEPMPEPMPADEPAEPMPEEPAKE